MSDEQNANVSTIFFTTLYGMQKLKGERSQQQQQLWEQEFQQDLAKFRVDPADIDIRNIVKIKCTARENTQPTEGLSEAYTAVWVTEKEADYYNKILGDLAKLGILVSSATGLYADMRR